MPLTFTIDRRGEGVRLALAGDLDLSESDFAGSVIQLVVTDKSLDRGCVFTATNAHGVVRRILEVTGLLEVLSGEAPEQPETSADPRW